MRWVNGLGVIALMVACSDSAGGGVTVDPAESSSSAASSSAAAGSVDYSRAHAVNALLGRGINMGNSLDARCRSTDPRLDSVSYADEPYEPFNGWDDCWGNAILQDDFVRIKNAGFQSVRIPVRWGEKASDVAPYTIPASFTARVREVVAWANAAGLPAIINIHHYDELYDDNRIRSNEAFTLQREKFVELWRQIAFAFQDVSNDSLVFEILNEGRARVTVSVLNEMLAEVWPVIRESNPDRTLMINPSNWGAYTSLPSVIVPGNDGNVILSGHFYLPMAFSHQGMDGNPTGVSWGKTSDRNALFLSIEDTYSKLRAAFVGIDGGTVPLNIGEFGASADGALADRAAYTQALREAIEAKGMSWHYWGFTRCNFDAYSRSENQWIAPILQALIPSDS